MPLLRPAGSGHVASAGPCLRDKQTQSHRQCHLSRIITVVRALHCMRWTQYADARAGDPICRVTTMETTERLHADSPGSPASQAQTGCSLELGPLISPSNVLQQQPTCPCPLAPTTPHNPACHLICRSDAATSSMIHSRQPQEALHAPSC
jgi:hypothetical protein